MVKSGVCGFFSRTPDLDSCQTCMMGDKAMILPWLIELCALLHEKAPPTTTRQRGFAAIAAGRDPPTLKSLREFDREIAWCLWRRRTTSSSG